MARLLVIKNGSEYVRFTDQGYHLCTMNKASVFGLDAKEEVRELINGLHSDGLEGAGIFQLTITETPFEE